MIKKIIVGIICIACMFGAFVGYRYYAFTYRYENEAKTELTETNTDSLFTEDEAMKYLKKYDFIELNMADLSENSSYIIPGLKATKTLESNNSHEFSMCTSMTPQGLCVTEKYVIISAYCHTHRHNSVLYLMDKKTHKFIKEIILPGKPHVGNIAYDDVNNNIWVACVGTNFLTGGKSAYLNRISLEKIEEYDFNESKETIMFDKKYSIVGFKNASYISYYRGNLFVGNYYTGEWKDAYVVRFPIMEDGGLETKRVLTTSGVKEMAYGKEKAVIDECCQGIYFDKGYCLLMQSSGTSTSMVYSFVNSDYQRDVDHIIDMEQLYNTYTKQSEVVSDLLKQCEQMESEFSQQQEELEKLDENIEIKKSEIEEREKELKKEEDEDNESEDEELISLHDELLALEQQKEELEEKLTSSEEEVESARNEYEESLVTLEKIGFDQEEYQACLSQTKEYSLENKLAVYSLEFPPRLEQALVSKYTNYKVYLLFESGAYSYRAQMTDVVDRIIILG